MSRLGKHNAAWCPYPHAHKHNVTPTDTRTLASSSPNSSSFCFSGVSSSSADAAEICAWILPISVAMPVDVTTPTPLPLATAVPANSMPSLALGVLVCWDGFGLGWKETGCAIAAVHAFACVSHTYQAQHCVQPHLQLASRVVHRVGAFQHGLWLAREAGLLSTQRGCPADHEAQVCWHLVTWGWGAGRSARRATHAGQNEGGNAGSTKRSGCCCVG